MAKNNALPTRADDFSAWYIELIKRAGLAENSPVRGCMVIKPYGYAIRENIQRILDRMFKQTGHQNAYFPLFIPKSFLSKEADHVEGFAKECAVITHHRLRTSEHGGVEVDPDAKLDEELIVRPTSETIIRDAYSRRINSYRDLPVLVNQRANVVRREMRTRLFLRTAEFLWQEGHTAHASRDEAIDEAKRMHDVYNDLLTNFLGIYGICGVKSESERFAGADETYTIEPQMQDHKALQICTSHFLGQNFAKAMDVTYTTADNTQDYPRATSWGLSTRSMGGLIMAHSDDSGLVLPPAIAPIHVVIIPILPKNADADHEEIMTTVRRLADQLREVYLTFESAYYDQGVEMIVHIDDDTATSYGRKCNERELKGVPIRLGLGPKDLDAGVAELAIRDKQTKQSIPLTSVVDTVVSELSQMQTRLYETHKSYSLANTRIANTYDEFVTMLEDGFVLAHWDGTPETEAHIQEQTSATIRCIPAPGQLEQIDSEIHEPGTCIISGQTSAQRVVFAKAY